MGDGGATFHEVKPVDSARSKAGMKSEGDCLLRGLGRGCGGSGQTVAVLSGRQATCRSEAETGPVEMTSHPQRLPPGFHLPSGLSL